MFSRQLKPSSFSATVVVSNLINAQLAQQTAVNVLVASKHHFWIPPIETNRVFHVQILS
jgi:hypothetical protein